MFQFWLNKSSPQVPIGHDDRIVGRIAWWYGHQG